MESQPNLLTHELSFSDMVKNIYSAPPMDAFSVHFEFLDEIKKEEVKKYLAYFVMEGAKIKYNKQLAELVDTEIATLSEYLHSIGWDVSFQIETKTQNIEGKDIPVNYFLIDFFPYNTKNANFIAGKF
jgi:hypothetical protein